VIEEASLANRSSWAPKLVTRSVGVVLARSTTPPGTDDFQNL
jgi:hypothetical protein